MDRARPIHKLDRRRRKVGKAASGIQAMWSLSPIFGADTDRLRSASC